MNAKHLKDVATKLVGWVGNSVEENHPIERKIFWLLAHMAVFMAERAQPSLKDEPAASPAEWLIWSREHKGWWRPARSGYTKTIHEAGLHTLDQATAICATAACGWRGGEPEESMIRIVDITSDPPEPAKDWLVYELDARAYYLDTEYGYVDSPEHAGRKTWLEAMEICRTMNIGKSVRVAMVPAP